jgi:hypothetical protein
VTVAIDGVTSAYVVGPGGVREGTTALGDSAVTFVPQVPGFYRVFRGGEQVAVVAANPDPRESDLRPVDLTTLRRELVAAGARAGPDRSEWWEVVFGCLLAVMVCEALLSAPR